MKTIQITSVQNDLVKYAAKLANPSFRKSEKMILLDGNQTIMGVIEDNIEFEYLFLKSQNPLKDKARAKNLVIVNDEILKKISTTKSPTDVVGIIKEPEFDKNIFKKIEKIALIDSIKDAGNLGTIIRSAAAFSIGGIILLGECVDIYNTKTIRSSAQNIFKIPIIKLDGLKFIEELKKTHKLISTTVDSDIDFWEADFGGKIMLAFGSEAFGISDNLARLSDEKVTIKMDNNVESLNLGVCASIAFAFMYHKNKM